MDMNPVTPPRSTSDTAGPFAVRRPLRRVPMGVAADTLCHRPSPLGPEDGEVPLATHVSPRGAVWFVIGASQRLMLHAAGRTRSIEVARGRAGSVLCWCVADRPEAGEGVAVLATVRDAKASQTRVALIPVSADGVPGNRVEGDALPAEIGEPLRLSRDSGGHWWLQCSGGGLVFDDSVHVLATFVGAGVALPTGHWLRWEGKPSCAPISGKEVPLEFDGDFCAGPLLVAGLATDANVAYVVALEGEPLFPAHAKIPLVTAAVLAVNVAEHHAAIVDNVLWPAARYARPRSTEDDQPEVLSYFPIPSLSFSPSVGLTMIEHAPLVCVVHAWPLLRRGATPAQKFDDLGDFSADELSYFRSEWNARRGGAVDAKWKPLLQRLPWARAGMPARAAAGADPVETAATARLDSARPAR